MQEAQENGLVGPCPSLKLSDPIWSLGLRLQVNIAGVLGWVPLPFSQQLPHKYHFPL